MSFTLHGTYVTPVEHEGELSEDGSPDGGVPEGRPDDSTTGWATAQVFVTYETVNETGETEIVEIAAGSFFNGKVTLTGTVIEPTSITITVDRGEEHQKLTTTTLIRQGIEEVSFAIVDRQVAYRPPRVVLVGNSNRARDESKKFTVFGDFGSMTDELSLPIVSVGGHGSVLLDDGKFIIESEIDEPRRLFVSASAGETAFNEYSGVIQVVVEQGSKIEISPSGWGRELVATADSGYHKQLVDSWQQTEDYQAVMNDYAQSYKAFRDAWAARWRASQNSSQETESNEETQNITQEDSDDNYEASEENEPATEDQEQEPVLAFSNGIPPVEECEHVSIAELDGKFVDATNTDNNPEYHQLFLKMNRLRVDALENLAVNSEDPMQTLLAIELGAFGFDSTDRRGAVPLYDKIAKVLDEDIVARRVTGARDDLVSELEISDNDKNLVPGQKAPSFTLPKLDGSEVALVDVLAEKEIVLIDFWASWCGPCIATFPALKKLHSKYNDKGFEIIAIDLDSTSEAWEEASEEHDLPWLDLGETVEPGEGEVSNSYGVQFIPKTYLLDSSGCILHKELSTDELERVLLAKFGVPNDS